MVTRAIDSSASMASTTDVCRSTRSSNLGRHNGTLSMKGGARGRGCGHDLLTQRTSGPRLLGHG
jgi:hypothetical protein